MKTSQIYIIVKRLRARGYDDNHVIKYLKKYYNIEL